MPACLSWPPQVLRRSAACQRSSGPAPPRTASCRIHCLEMLHLAAFLIGGDDQLVAARSIALQRVSGGLGCGCAVVPVADEHHGTDMACADEALRSAGLPPANIGAMMSCPARSSRLIVAMARLALAAGSHRLPSDAPEISAVSVWGPCRGSASKRRTVAARDVRACLFAGGAASTMPCLPPQGHHAEHGRDDGGAELGRGLLPPCLICCILICTSVGHHV